MTSHETLPTGLLIGHEWRHETTAGTMEHRNPATGEMQQIFPIAGAREIDDAVAAARAGLRAWRAFAPAERRDVLRRVAAGFREQATELGRIGVLETGLLTPLAEMLPQAAAEWFEYYAGWCDKITGDVIPLAEALDYTVPEPVGVVAVILTWNGPVGGTGMAVAAPLAAGCAVVLKAPELSPFSASLIGRICVAAGLPPGVLNVVVGGPETGDLLVRHPGIDKIAFTGSPTTARRIQAAAAETLTPLLLELGGKSATIVFEDADLDTAVAAVVAGVCSMNGQTCIAPTRLLVQRSIYGDVVDRVHHAMTGVIVGGPSAPASEMGPLISGPARDRVLQMIADAQRDRSGRLLVGGARPSCVSGNGYYVEPTAFVDVDNSAEIAQNEIFGPVLAVMPFDGEAEAVRTANASHYGLAAYLHTRDIERAHRVASALDAGNVAVNGGTPVAGPYAPFGGFKQSGHGKEGGQAGLTEFLRIKNVNLRIGSVNLA